MSDAYLLGGGCLCGQLRYEVKAAPAKAGYCHCRSCQRLTGAPAMVWAQIPIEAFSYVAGAPAVYQSSETGERRFCPRCGGHVEFRRRPDPKTVEIMVATLDDPSRMPPQVHIFTECRIPWFDTIDHLPRRLRMT